jgi:hypothetical protein
MWAERVAAFRASDQSAPEWCAAQHLNVKQLHYWKRKFVTEAAATTSAASPSPQWLPVVLEEPGEPRAPGLQIHIGPVQIAVFPGFDAQLLHDVVDTLVALCLR